MLLLYYSKGLQEATSELVSTLNNAFEEKQKKSAMEGTTTTNDASPMDAVGFTSEPFEFEYTFKVNRNSNQKKFDES